MIGTLKHIYHLVVQSSLSQINFNCKFKLNFLLVQQPPACNTNTQSDSLGLAYLPWVGRSVGGGRLLSTCWLASGDDNGNNDQKSRSGRVCFFPRRERPPPPLCFTMPAAPPLPLTFPITPSPRGAAEVAAPARE